MADHGGEVAAETAAKAHRINPKDDVAVALTTIAAGEAVTLGDLVVVAQAEVPKGHKIALKSKLLGEPVLKYGFPIGKATQEIAPGDHVHVHNLATLLGGPEAYEYHPGAEPLTTEPTSQTFMGYVRKNGRVGTRNEIWVLTTVGCVTRTAERIAKIGAERFAGRVDGVLAITHPFGCSQLGDDLDHTRKIISSLASHPNAGGVLLLGLGCENNQIDKLLESAPEIDRSRLRAFAAQMTEDETEAGLEALEELVALAEQDRREPRPLSDLSLGLKCGGSDGFSGLTANPLLGRVAERLAAAGGRPILTEIPEIFGAERLLMDRAIGPEVFQGVVDVVNDFKTYFISHNQPVYENPSPGNKAGGITTLEEKSLGAVQKAGHAPVTQVLRYGEQTYRPGLALLEAPGNDGVSSTALVAAGATIVLFTTGRGTPLGFPAPTLKIATNSALAEKKPHWIDFDAGPIVRGESLDAAADRLMAKIIETASGAPARNEVNGEREIAIWKGGVTL